MSSYRVRPEPTRRGGYPGLYWEARVWGPDDCDERDGFLTKTAALRWATAHRFVKTSGGGSNGSGGRPST